MVGETGVVECKFDGGADRALPTTQQASTLEQPLFANLLLNRAGNGAKFKTHTMASKKMSMGF
eukprot:3423889-Amphidinium_carterae.1